jgi:Tfp pilus assembly protein PilX
MDRLPRWSGSFADSGNRPAPVGFALPAALLMLLLIAALVAGVFSAITEETRIGVAAAERHLALLTAESAVELTITSLSVVAGESIGIGETRSRSVEGLAAPTMVYVTRLDSSRYWVVADAGGASPNSGIARRVGVVVRAARAADGSMTIDRISERAWSELF